VTPAHTRRVPGAAPLPARARARRPLLRVLPIALLCLLAAGSLARAAPADAAQPASADPLRALGADSPLCSEDVGAEARAACARTGALEHPHPLGNYALDSHIATGPTRIGDSLWAMLASLASLAWVGALYALKGVLLALQWAFELDLMGAGLADARRALLTLHERTLGSAWLEAALSVLGLWGIWRGFVQRRATETVAGLALAAVLMAGALWVIHDPSGSVGALSSGANAVSLGFLAGASDGTVARPTRSVADGSRQLFDALVLRPWCALQFGDVAWCLARAPGDSVARAERWLRHAPGSKERTAEYEALRSGDPEEAAQEETLGLDVLDPDDADVTRQLEGYVVRPEDKGKVAMQEVDAVPGRIGLLGLVLLAQVGALLVLGWLALQILVQAIWALLLLLGAPLLLFAPAFGEAGRAVFRRWALRLLAACVAKAIYALLLGVVLALSGVLAAIGDTLPWFAVWLLQIVFWWGLLVKRRDLLGPLAPRGPSASELHYRARNAAAAAGALAAPVLAPARALGAGVRAGTQEAGLQRRASHDARRRGAQEGLEARADERLGVKYRAAHAQVASHDDAERKLRSVDRGLAAYDRRQAEGPRPGKDGKLLPKPAPSPAEVKLIAQRKALKQKLMDPTELGVARQFIKTADRSQVEQGRRFSPAQREAQIEELREEVGRDRSPRSPSHGWRTGMPAEELDALPAEKREDTFRRIGLELDRDRRHLGVVKQDPHAVPSRRERRAVRSAVDRETFRRHRSEEVRRRRHERRELRMEHHRRGLRVRR
jgi:hypothetical protein